MQEVDSPPMGALSPTRFQLETVLANIPQDFAGSPTEWLSNIRQRISQLARECPTLEPENREYLTEVLSLSRQIVRQQLSEVRACGNRPLDTLAIASRVDIGMMELSRRMSEPFDSKLIPTTEHFIPLEQLLDESRGRLRMSNGSIQGEPLQFLEIQNPITAIWYPVTLPLDDRMWHKGGPPRAVLDVFVGADDKRLAAELPFNDFDALCVGDEYMARRNAELIGISPEGVEMMRGEFNFSKFATSRDTNQNCVLLGRQGLHFSDDAYNAAVTGHIKITGNYIAEKAIYNNDRWTWQDLDTGEQIDMPKQRGVMRMIKCVAEGKAETMEYKPITDNLDFGIYSLYLAKRWSRKPNFGELVQNMYVLMKKINQTKVDEDNVMDVLERVHRGFPFFDMESEMSDLTDVVRWKAKKLIKQLDREAGWKYHLSSGLVLKRKPLDTVSYEVGLDCFQPDPRFSKQFLEWWPGFIDRSKRRTLDYEEMCQRTNIPPTVKYFYVLESGLIPDFVTE